MNNSLKAIVVAVLFFSAGACAQEANNTNVAPHRSIKDQTIVSQALPKATLTVAEDFRFIGTQQVNLYGNADAEQYLFVKSGPHGSVDRFYWVQFEHFLPTNKLTYNYDWKCTMQLGGLPFVCDVKTWPNFATLLADDAASDGAAIERLLKKHDLFLPQRTALVRLFHLPTTDRRTELMIIYGEALPQQSPVPVREGGVDLNAESASSARTFLDRARRGFIVRTQ